MNLIVICADTVRADYLGCYGNDWVKTPHLDKLGHEGIVFENAYVEGLPTIPERTVFFTGKFTLPFRGWQPLWNFDLEISKILGRDDKFWGVRTLGEGDYLNAFITDTYHFWAPGMNFHRGFHEYRWIRGQEFDRYRADAEGGVDPRTHFKPEWNVEEKELPRSLRALRQYAANNAGRESEEDYLPAKVAKEGMAWLERNQDEKFFLWLDFFDPHEPWDPPDTYYDMYRNPTYEGPKLIWANLVNSVAEGGLNDQELQEAKALYAAELSLVDHWIGEFLCKVEQLGLMEETLIVFVSDHGSAHGERGPIGKNMEAKSEVTRVPLLIRSPDGPHGKRIEDLVWTPDLLPTVLEILDVEAPPTIHGKSFWPFVLGETDHHRDYTVSGWRRSPRRYVRTPGWSYIHNEQGEDELHDLASDPGETVNVISQYPEQAEQMEAMLREFQRQGAKLNP